MKTIKLLSLFILLSFFVGAFAQKSEQGDDNIKTFKIAFITKRLDLTSDQAEKFWPVYNQYQEELRALREKNKKALLNVYLNIDNLSEKDMEKVLDDEIAFHQSELDVTKKYVPKFKTVLPVRKVLKLFKAEEEFKSELLKRSRQNNR